MSLSKIKLGRNLKKNRFDLSHDVNTTADFGFCQPLLGREMMPDSKMSVKLNSILRLAPMPVPTYGRVDYRTYHQFVPYNDLLPSFDNMLAGLSYGNASKSYVPTSVPYFQLKDLTRLLWHFSYMSVYSFDDKNKTYFCVSTDKFPDDARRIFCDEFGTTAPAFKDFAVPNCQYKSDDSRDGFSPVLPLGADFVLEDKDNNYIYCIKLNKFGRNLRKIFLGLGYQISFNNLKKVSFLPVFAYYRAWFDLFAVKQDINWTDTSCYRILDFVCQFNHYALSYSFADATFGALLKAFLNDLCKCYYTFEQDFISAHIRSTSISDSGNHLSAPYRENGFTNVDNAKGYIPSLQGTITSPALSLLSRLTKYVNKNTIIGGNIYKFLNTHFGLTDAHLEDSYRIGTNITNVNISDVISLSGSPGNGLGNYAGKGYGINEGDMISYEAKSFGIWITLAVVVPHGGYVQGLDYNLTHVDRLQFPTPEFDSLGMQVSSKDVVFCDSDVVPSAATFGGNDSFGFIPRYFEHKVSNNVLNGDMSLRSRRGSFAPYTLDRFISPADLSCNVTSGKTFKDLRWHNLPSIPAASSIWRKCSEYPYLQNFDRIFNDSPTIVDEYHLLNDIPDNFIIHNYFEMYYFAPLMSVAESFDTDATSDDVVTTEKA